MGVDVSKMPLGDIDQRTIDSGMGALLELEKEFKKKSPNRTVIEALCSKFYTYIPHAFGMKVCASAPPPPPFKIGLPSAARLLSLSPLGNATFRPPMPHAPSCSPQGQRQASQSSRKCRCRCRRVRARIFLRMLTSSAFSTSLRLLNLPGPANAQE